MKEKANGILDKHIPLPWLLGVLFAIVAWGFTLQHRVDAMYDKGVTLREEFESNTTRVQNELSEIKKTVDNIHDNQLIIMYELGLKPVE